MFFNQNVHCIIKGKKELKMNKKQKMFCAAILTVALSILPAAAFAHGGHHGNRGNHCGSYENRDTYYYCDGHQAHLHANGSCPYAQASSGTADSSDVYYYCDGHQAHLHANGSCPYANSDVNAFASANPQAAPARFHAACWQRASLQNPLMPCYDMLQFTMNYQSALCLDLTANGNEIGVENNLSNMPLCQINNGTCPFVQNTL